MDVLSLSLIPREKHANPTLYSLAAKIAMYSHVVIFRYLKLREHHLVFEVPPSLCITCPARPVAWTRHQDPAEES